MRRGREGAIGCRDSAPIEQSWLHQVLVRRPVADLPFAHDAGIDRRLVNATYIGKPAVEIWDRGKKIE